MDSSKTPQEEMLEARRQINPTELYSILVDNEYININLYPYPKEEVYSSLKGILGSLRLQIGYNESYSWIFDLVIKTNNRFFGEYFILLKYHQNKMLDIPHDENIYELIRALKNTFHELKAYFKNESLTFDQKERRLKSQWDSNKKYLAIVEDFYADSINTFDKLEIQYKKENHIEISKDLNFDSNFQKYIKDQRVIDTFLAELWCAFYFELNKKLIIEKEAQADKKGTFGFYSNIPDGFNIKATTAEENEKNIEVCKWHNESIVSYYTKQLEDAKKGFNNLSSLVYGRKLTLKEYVNIQIDLKKTKSWNKERLNDDLNYGVIIDGKTHPQIINNHRAYVDFLKQTLPHIGDYLGIIKLKIEKAKIEISENKNKNLPLPEIQNKKKQEIAKEPEGNESNFLDEQEKVKNKFNTMELEMVEQHFRALVNIQSTNGKSFLSETDLKNFIKAAFIENKPLKEKLKFNMVSGEMKTVQNIFYSFYFACKGEYENTSKGIQLKYLNLLKENFEGFKNLSSRNFARYYIKTRK